MKFVAAKCPSCSGDLQIPDDREFVKCMYCGCEIRVREVIKLNVASDYSTEIKLWKLDAEKALRKGNHEKAIDIYDKILVVDSTNLDATYSIARIQMLMHFGPGNGNYLSLDLEEANDFSHYETQLPKEELEEIFEKLYFVLSRDVNIYGDKVIELVIECVESLFNNCNHEIWMKNINKHGVENAYSNKPEAGVSKEKDLMVALLRVAGTIGLFERFLQIIPDNEIIKARIKELCDLALQGGYYKQYGKKFFGGDDVFIESTKIFPIYEPIKSLFNNCKNKY